MISNLWIERRRGNWDRLEALVQQVESFGLSVLNADELRDFGLLYRQAAADLSAVRSDHGSRTLEEYLNRLLTRAHNYIYAGKKVSLGGILRFFTVEYPRIFRRLQNYVLVSLVAMLAGAALGAVLSVTHPGFMRDEAGPFVMENLEQHKMWTDQILPAKTQTSSWIMTNNITVCMETFAGGIVFGLFTLLMLVRTGLQLGAISVACAQYHMALNFWGFVASHGALELPSIIISGAAGLRLSSGFLFPGVLRRKVATMQAGRESVRLLAGTVPLLVIAGLLEAYLSPTSAPYVVRFTVGGVLLTALLFWLIEGGRDRADRETPAEAVAN